MHNVIGQFAPHTHEPSPGVIEVHIEDRQKQADVSPLDYFRERREIHELIEAILTEYTDLHKGLAGHMDMFYRRAPEDQLDMVREGLSRTLSYRAHEAREEDEQAARDIHAAAEARAEAAAQAAADQARARVYKERDEELARAKEVAIRREEEAIQGLFQDNPGLREWSETAEGKEVIEGTLLASPSNIYERGRALEGAVFSREFQRFQDEQAEQEWQAVSNAVASADQVEELQQSMTDTQVREIFPTVIAAVLAKRRGEAAPDLSGNEIHSRYEAFFESSLEAGKTTVEGLEGILQGLGAEKARKPAARGSVDVSKTINSTH